MIAQVLALVMATATPVHAHGHAPKHHRKHVVKHVLASSFGPFGVDRYAGHSFACERFRVSSKARALVDAEMIFADRKSKCGAIRRICSERSKKCTEAVRWDAGPWGKRHKRYRYGIDLWHTLAKQIHHDGRFVTIEVLSK